MLKKGVTIVIDFKIYFYLFEPIIRHLISQNVQIFIVAPKSLRTDIKLTFQSERIKFINYEELKRRHKLRFIVHRICTILFTRNDFSYQFYKKRNQITKKATTVHSFLYKLSVFIPKVSNSRINEFLSFVSGLWFENPFPTREVMVGSLNSSPELLVAKGQTVTTVMESWDHAVKAPNGYKSDLFLGWNESLCEDWRCFQGDQNCRIFHPLKLRYAHEIYKGLPNKSKTVSNRRIKVLYPIAGTKKFSIDVLVQIERMIIQELIHLTELLDWDLCLKPRPNGLVGEFDYAKDFSHVSVGDVSHGSIVNPADYFFSDQENFDRFSILNDIDIVINAFTTFGLDSAVAGLPVLQLDLRYALGFESSSLIYNNYHIEKYLINKKNVIKPIGDTLLSYISDSKLDLFSMASDYSRELCEWLYLYPSSSDAINECINSVSFKETKR